MSIRREPDSRVRSLVALILVVLLVAVVRFGIVFDLFRR
jgi:hypothetical protein